MSDNIEELNYAHFVAFTNCDIAMITLVDGENVQNLPERND